MKTSIKLFLVLLIVSACATKPIKIPPPQKVSGLKTPTLIIPSDADKNMLAAANVFGQYANSDEFYDFARKEISDLEGGNETNVENGISKFRTCLDQTPTVNIQWKYYALGFRSRVIGGWRKNFLAQNPRKDLDTIERASHWIHEISHACGFTHVENDIVRYPVIKRSFPYQLGYAFEKFLKKKAE